MGKNVTIESEEFNKLLYGFSMDLITAGVTNKNIQIIAHIDERLNELVEALEGVTRIVEAFSYTTHFAPSQKERLEKAKAALKKARGE